MKITPKTRWQLRIHNALFVLLLTAVAGVVAWLSLTYKVQLDWTSSNRNTLSEDSRTLLGVLRGPVEIVAFVQDDMSLHQRIKNRLERYQRHKPDIQVGFVNPDLEPERAKQAGVRRPGQLLIRMSERSEIVDDMAEQTITNALQRLARGQDRWAVFLEGHGERNPFDTSNPGMNKLVEALRRTGLKVQALNLIRTPALPDNTSLLVIASPRSPLLPGERELIRQYVDEGGNLLWLQDPGGGEALPALADALGIRFVEGVVVDANPQLRALLGIKHPAVLPIVDYGQHQITRNLGVHTLFPFASAISLRDETSWKAQEFVVTLPRAWSEIGSLAGHEVTYNQDDGDTAGPLIIGVSLTRVLDKRQQRVVVLGDSDFLANAYLGNGGNLELALNIFHWLSRDDELISIVASRAPDTQLVLTKAEMSGLALGLLVVPLSLLTAGFTIWFRRRRQ